MTPEEKEKIKRLLEQGNTYRSIAQEMNCSLSNIAVYSLKFGLRRKKYSPPNVYDWEQIQREFDEGATRKELYSKYGFSKASLGKALRNGKVKHKHIPLIKLSIKDYSSFANGKFATPVIRRTLKRILLREGKQHKCDECGITEWRNNRLIFELDHIDGDSSNNLPINLRFLCPNCHSQTKTWRGRNIKRKRELRKLKECGTLV